MRILMFLLFCSVMAPCLSGCGGASSTSPSNSSFTDPRDGQVYPLVRIGSQVWFARNLDYKGTGTDSVGNCQLNVAANCLIYGRLYSWAEVQGDSSRYNSVTLGGASRRQGICPTGTHVPSDSEWSVLDISVHGNGKAIKSTLWDGNDSSGFEALPGGSRYQGTFNTLGTDAYFWTSTEAGATSGAYWYLYTSDSAIHRTAYLKSSALSLRCIRD